MSVTIRICDECGIAIAIPRASGETYGRCPYCAQLPRLVTEAAFMGWLAARGGITELRRTILPVGGAQWGRYCTACGHRPEVPREQCDCVRCKAEQARTLARIAERRARRVAP